MGKYLRQLTHKLYKVVTSWSKNNKLIIVILGVALFVRVYRVNMLLGFWYDQGRDALVIWDLWHKGKLFLIGPTTGLTDIFLGPFYYYLIAPFYLIGKGNPFFPAIFLSFTTVIGTGLLYQLGKKYYSKKVGIIAALITAISYQIVYLSRWLSNPTSIFLSSVILLYLLTELVNKGDRKLWIFVALIIGLSLNFEAASAFFYIPVTLVVFIYILFTSGKKYFPNLSVIFLAIGTFVLIQLPQVIFNLRHDNILFKAFSEVLLKKENVSVLFWSSLKYRADFFWNSFSEKIFPQPTMFAQISFILLGILLIIKINKFRKNPLFVTLLMFLLIPLVGYTLFQGNYGQLFDYYLMGYYYPFILLLSIILMEFWSFTLGKVFVLIFIIIFSWQNGRLTRNYITTGLDGPASVLIGNQMNIINWIYNDAKGSNFNIDIYVPPVIPYSYNYLLLWQGNVRCGKSLCGLKNTSDEKLLYTIYETDFPHPERLNEWFKRQNTIGIVQADYSFGGVAVQRRSRISK